MQIHKIALILTAMAFIAGDCHAAVKKTKATKSRLQKRLKINPITDSEGAWVANLETDVYRAGTFENLTVGYSAKNGWDISLSLLNVQILGNNNHFQANTFLNIAKTYEINNQFSLTLGSQNGTNLAGAQPHLWYNFSFLDNRYDVVPWFSIHAGAYLANAAITTTSRQLGFLTGIEIDFIQNKLSFQVDYISGHQALSGANANLLFNITPRWQIYLGVLVPEHNSGNEFAGILGFNLSDQQL